MTAHGIQPVTRVGCMPSKLLISSANRMHDIQSAKDLALQHEAVVDT